MPLLGFFGFPPFALECYVAYRVFVLLRQRYLKESKLAPVLVLVIGLVYCALIFRGIDRHTVWTWTGLD
ncbi:MAG: hypothetical protein EHM61_10720 [Acidobacteria bacterium]|nr:MAG: hypothetical protein EHM61_10720 [Acidobacteriota bacterium]